MIFAILYTYTYFDFLKLKTNTQESSCEQYTGITGVVQWEQDERRGTEEQFQLTRAASGQVPTCLTENTRNQSTVIQQFLTALTLSF